MSDVVYQRRSIRKYSDKAVSRELIEQIIDAARMSPSAKNRQPWKYIIFGRKRKAEFLECMKKGIDREENGKCALPNSKNGLADAKHTLSVMEQAPVIIAVLNTNGASPFLPINADDRITELCDVLSIGASIENMLLKATELGLGTLWIANTCYAYEELTDYLRTEHQLLGAIAVGYAEESPSQRPRKKTEDIAEYRMQ